MRVFVTKYALTKGVMEMEVSATSHPNMVNAGSGIYYHAGEWWKSLDEAIAHAKALRERRIVSLEKQLAKLAKRGPIKVRLVAEN